MNREKFEVIVVGGGLAGLSAAYVLAKAGVEVLVVELGSKCGGKNVTGGRLYGHSLERMIPGFAKEAPVERRITKERVSFMTQKDAVTMEYQSDGGPGEAWASYSVQRGSFDQWLADKAEAAGAMVVCGVRVDRLIEENKKIVGIQSGEDCVYADAVILADGVNSLLAQQLGMKTELDAHEVAIGVKEVISLDEKTISSRFGQKNGEGTAWMMVGDPTDGAMGGGFLYTNKKTISLGIVMTVGDIGHTQLSVSELIERLKSHPSIAPYLEGGKSVEYSAHLVTEGGYKMIPQLYRDGLLVTGDAAALVINLGYTVRGMDFAIESGRLAAETVLQARATADYTAKTLSLYEQQLEQSFVLREMKHYQDFPAFMSGSHRLYEDYGVMLSELMQGIFTVGKESESDPLIKVAKSIGKVGLVNLAIDGVRGLGALI